MLEAQVIKVKNITPTVREFTLRTPQAFTWSPGAHVQVRVQSGQRTLLKHYSLLPCDEPLAIRIAVKRQDAGQGGSLAMWQFEQGNMLEVSLPRQDFPLDMNAPEYLLVAGGIGITPLISMVQALQARGSKFRLVYAAQSVHELPYAAKLHALMGERLITRFGMIEDWKSLIEPLAPRAQAYVCGPAGMLKMVQNAWQESGRERHLLRFESFGSGASTEFATQEFLLNLPRHALQIKVPAEQSLLGAIEAAGVQAMSGCLRGQCGLCVTRVLSLDGQIEHRDVFLSDTQKRSNEEICVCVSRVQGSITLDSAYRPDTLTSTRGKSRIPVSETLHA